MDIKLFKKICETPGPPGFEQNIRNLIIEEIKLLVNDIQIDNMGNVIAIKKGKKNKKAMIAAHMDEIGFIVTHIDENGFLKFNPLGGFDPKTLTAQRVIVHGKKDIIGVMGTKPIHVMTEKEKQNPPQITDYYIDLGMTKKEVEKFVSIGTPVTREREFIEMGNCINSKSIDNRVAVFILIEVLKELKNKDVPYDIYGVFTVQEEVGIRGASVASLKIQPDFGFALDTTIAYDVPGAKPEEKITQLGKGTAIKIMDSSTICDYRMVNYMKNIAKKYKIKWQPEILTKGGTDTAGIQRMTAGGAISGAISVPTRYIHQVIEMANKNDILASIDLLKYCLLDLDKFNWNFN